MVCVAETFSTQHLPSGFFLKIDQTEDEMGLKVENHIKFDVCLVVTLIYTGLVSVNGLFVNSGHFQI